MTVSRIAIFLFFGILSIPAFSADEAGAGAEVPAIGIEELESRVKKGDVLLLDANGSKYFAKGHIPGAIDADARSGDLVAALGEDKARTIVVYCGADDCEAWQTVAEAVRSLGYTDIRHFPPGISGWIAAGKETGRTDR